jgi:hypothetical protein
MVTAAHSPQRKASKVQECDKPGTLHLRALTLLEKEIAKQDDALWLIAANVGVPYHWLVALRRGAIKQPSVNRIQHLVTKLSGKEVRN